MTAPSGPTRRKHAEHIEQIANAVLYEGYMLYPYRPSAVKNRQRWNFGVLHPKEFSVRNGGFDAWCMETQVLVVGTPQTKVHVSVRFLRAVARQVYRFTRPAPQWNAAELPGHQPVDQLRVGDRVFRTWQEASEHEIEIPGTLLSDLVSRFPGQLFAFPGALTLAPVTADGGNVPGMIEWRVEQLKGVVTLSAEQLTSQLFRVTLTIENLTPWALDSAIDLRLDREAPLERSMLSTHAILGVEDGEFVSLLDPGDEWQQAASGCRNTGLWPVLAGEPGTRHTMLASPVILYDYPAIAPESPGDLFDGTEIDEILSLRVLTLTDDEKREIRESDDRARLILDRTEDMPQEHFMKLHGAMRQVQSDRKST